MRKMNNSEKMAKNFVLIFLFIHEEKSDTAHKWPTNYIALAKNSELCRVNNAQ